MKNFKKVLALVLVVAMMMSFVVVASAKTTADYTDADKVTYTEAVDVLSSLEVLTGYPDGTFKPTATITRAEAAKIIAMFANGTTDISTLYASMTTPFADVKGHWAESYVNYCYATGIVSGKSETMFDPDANVTGIEFLKMALIVLGYNADAEGFKGVAWMVNVMKRAEDAGLLIKGWDAAKAITREEAAQVALNTLKGTMVRYENGTSISVNGVTVATSATRDTVAGAAATDTIKDDVKMQLAEKVYPKLSFTAADPDAFGREAYSWTYKDKKICTVTEKPAFTFNTAMQQSELFAALGAAGIQGTVDKFIVLSSIYEDGVQKATNTTTSQATYDDGTGDLACSTIIAQHASTNANIAGMGNGVVAEFYATTNPNVFKMVCYHEYIGTVTAVTPANEKTGAKRSVTVAGKIFETEDFAKKDVVLYTVGNKGIASMKLAETITGACSKITGAGKNITYTIGDAAYKLSELHTGAAPSVSAIPATWYVDSCGNLIKAKDAAKTAVQYGIVLDYAKGDYRAASNVGNLSAQEAFENVEIFTAEGKAVVYGTTFTTTDGVVQSVGTFDNVEGGTGIYKGDLVEYVVNEAGKISRIIEAGATAKTLTDHTKGTAIQPVNDGAYATDKTVFFVVKTSAATNPTAKDIAVYTGYAALPAATYTGADKSVLNAYAPTHATYSGAGAVKYTIGTLPDSTTKAQYMMLTGAPTIVASEKSGNYLYTYDAIVNGEAQQVTFEHTAAPTVTLFTLYDVTFNATTGYVSSNAPTAVTITPDKVNVTNAGLLELASNIKYVDSKTVYYKINVGSDATATSLGAKVTGFEAVSAVTTESGETAYVANITGGTTVGAPASVVIYYVVG